MRQMGGHGFVLGDEGSGAVLGRALLSRALRAADGLVDETPLLRQVLEDFGGSRGVIDFAASARPADFAALAPRLIDTDDAAAEAILSDAVADLHRMLMVLQGPGVLPVTFIGGLGPTYAARLGGHWPVRAPLGSALDGAIAMAREMEE
jgi:glucosamine kinase